MKLTKTVIKQFEADQKQHGTKIALFNFVWEIAAKLFNDIGVTSIKTGVREK